MKIHVYIAAFAAHKWLTDCFNSIVAAKNLFDPNGLHDFELIIGSDSCPQTTDFLSKNVESWRQMLPVHAYVATNNVGPFVLKNSLVQAHSDADVFCFMDADDAYVPDAFTRLLTPILSQPQKLHYVVGMTNECNERLVPTNTHKRAPGIVAMSRTAWHALGGFKSFRMAGDVDMMRRAPLNGCVITELKHAVILRRGHPNQLTRAKGTSLGSSARQTVSRQISNDLKAGIKRPIKFETVSLEQIGEPQPQKSIVKIPKVVSKSVEQTTPTLSPHKAYASLCTFPGREEHVAKAVASLLAQDIPIDIKIVLNKYNTIPTNLANVIQDKSNVTIEFSHNLPLGDCGAANKFHWITQPEHSQYDYHLTCDDDIVYPANYVSTMIEHCKRFENKAVVTLHGSLLTSPFERYFKSRNVIRFHQKYNETTRVHIGGTSVMCYRIELLKGVLKFSDFLHNNMIDISFALVCQRAKIGIVRPPSEHLWCKPLSTTDSIFLNSTKNIPSEMNVSDLATKTVLSHNRWFTFNLNKQPISEISLAKKKQEIRTSVPIIQKAPTVSFSNHMFAGEVPETYVIIPSFRNEQWIEGCLDSILSQQFPRKFEVFVGIDKCDATQKVVQKYITRNNCSNIRLFISKEETNRGPYGMRNALISKVENPDAFVFLFDSDDKMNNHYMLNMLKTWSNNRGGEPIVHPVCSHGNGSAAKYFPACSSVLYRKRIFDMAGGYSGWMVASDSDFLKRTKLLGIKNVVCRPAVVERNIHENSLTASAATGLQSELRKNARDLIKKRIDEKDSTPHNPFCTNIVELRRVSTQVAS